MRSALSGLCGLLAGLLLPLALVSVWLHTVVADTGEYLARVDPLAAEPEVREAVEEVLVDGMLQRVDLAALGDRLQTAVDVPGLDLTLPGLPADLPALPGDLDERLEQLRDEVGPLLEQARSDATGAAEELLRRVVGAVVASDAFAVLWSTAQRAGHNQVVSVLSSAQPLEAGEQVLVPLDVFVEAVQAQVRGLGLQLEDTLDGLSLALPLASADDLEAARIAYRLLERLWLVLPAAAVVLALGAVVLAGRRLRTLAVLGGLAALLCLGLLVVMGLAKDVVLDRGQSEAARTLTDRMLDALGADLRDTAVTGVLVGCAVLVAAALLGLLVRAGRALRRTVAG